MEALAPGLATLGLCFAVLPWLSRRSSAARSAVATVSLTFMSIYWLWRASNTLPPLSETMNWSVGVAFFAIETMALLAGGLSLVFLSRTIDRTDEVNRKLDTNKTTAPLVDVFICTYNEEQAILERTMIGALGLSYPNYRVWVLDDGRRDWLRELSEALGCRYLTRSDNAHAKAGNINNALRYIASQDDRPQFISILDADFVVTPRFLERAIALFDSSDVGLVQTPQHFANPDPIQTNLGASSVWPDEQRFFFDVVMPSKDAWGAAFCCGTSSVMRFEPLMSIGGFPTDSVTEDYLLTLRLKEIGYRTVYLNERLTLGLAPEGLKEYVTQRSRWCLGFMQIFRGRSGPFSFRSKLDFIDRLSLFEAFMGWFAVYLAKIAGLIVPPLFLLFGIKAVYASLNDMLFYFLPFYIWQLMAMAWISRGRSLAIMTDISQLLALPEVCKAIVAGLFKPQGQKFKVTAKGGDRSKKFVEWNLLKVHGIFLVLNLAGILNAFVIQLRGENIAYGGLALAWSIYNAVILTIVCFVCIEQPRLRKAERFPRNDLCCVGFGAQNFEARLKDISLSGASIDTGDLLPLGTPVELTLNGTVVSGTVIRVMASGYAVHFDDKLETRIAMIRTIYGGDYIRSFAGVKALPVGRAILARILG